ncbi:hypothetical protein AGOR_G00195430 [Albula goreensis]|uniref:Uncharacterized protein n=1 Tax=Albula goreensis TaxID=1534307 RepID=A0A8T3CZT2_9TELE|nr:hypothetical protein AGOR_G00195430 [Albula goreensis]
MPEPRDGVYIQVKYGDGSARGRRFCLQHSIQILFDFAGSDDMATEVFHIQTATSSTGTPSTATGSLSEHGLCGPTTVYVLWLGPEEVQEMLSHNTLVSVPVTSSEPSILLNANSGAVAEAAEGSVVALSWPWFIPIEEASVERPPLSPSHSPVTSPPNPHIPVGSTHLPTKRRRPDCSRLLERERAELQADREELERQKAELEADRAWLERQRAELDQERVVLERERVELEMDRDVLDREREKEETELERERTAVQRARERVEHSRRVLSLFHTLLQKL